MGVGSATETTGTAQLRPSKWLVKNVTPHSLVPLGYPAEQRPQEELDNQHGNWWLANLQMEAALTFKQYDYKFMGGTGGHSGKHGGAILPDSLRWLWRGPEPTSNAK